jgi:hypothetical protein
MSLFTFKNHAESKGFGFIYIYFDQLNPGYISELLNYFYSHKIILFFIIVVYSL